MDWWYKKRSWQALLLLPLSLVYSGLVLIRRQFYRCNLFKAHRFNVPVIVIGNITLGGTGKTPFIIWLSKWLEERGYHVGIVSRGYKSQAPKYPFLVKMDTSVIQSGDEPLLIAKNTHLPVVISPQRALAAQFLVEQHSCNLILSDDGLQHYALGRDYEFAIVDGARGIGNGLVFPAGPLRELPARLEKVDAVIINQSDLTGSGFRFYLKPQCLVNIKTQEMLSPSWLDENRCHAVAGIGNPARFFSSLKTLGAEIIEHSFPDHYHYSAKDFNFEDNLPIIMTEKDALKCEGFAGAGRMWYLRVEVVPNEALVNWLEKKFTKRGE